MKKARWPHSRLSANPSLILQIAEHRGRIVKTTGDGVLVEFASAVDAVRCAMDIQRAMAERNAAIPEDRRIEFRIGINVGDIIIEGEDIYGDGVNIAARLEGIAEAGGISISRQAFDQIEGKLQLAYREMGPQNLKNITKPVEVFSVEVDGTGEAWPIKIRARRSNIAGHLTGCVSPTQFRAVGRRW